MEKRIETDLADRLLSKIKANRPIDKAWKCNHDNKGSANETGNTDLDYLNMIPKGNMILDFLTVLSKKEESPIQMIALYGGWGSGKTSLMRYIEKNLDVEKFSKVFFEAWKLENDENLALSLLDTISKKNEGNIYASQNRIRTSLKTITKAALSGIKTPVYDVGKAFDTARQELENKSFSDVVYIFERSYSELETAILNDVKGNNRKLIVFIDDLDRCEPENVLRLLSAIKLFFTYGKKTIFICGLDEKAVSEAVKVKYGNVIKYGEYIEKIFDISFDMPNHNINKLITHYFIDKDISYSRTLIPDENKEIIKGVEKFFEAMHFTNPRHIIKVLNKYLLIRYYTIPLKVQGDPIDRDRLIPDQKIKLFMYITLFIIILYKFYKNEFYALKDYKAKFRKLENEIKNDVDKQFDKQFYIIDECSLGDMINIAKRIKKINNEEDTILRKMLTLLFAMPIDNYQSFQSNRYITQFLTIDNNSARFINFLVNNIIPISDLEKEHEACKYHLWNIFDMAERYL